MCIIALYKRTQERLTGLQHSLKTNEAHTGYRRSTVNVFKGTRSRYSALNQYLLSSSLFVPWWFQKPALVCISQPSKKKMPRFWNSPFRAPPPLPPPPRLLRALESNFLLINLAIKERLMPGPVLRALCFPSLCLSIKYRFSTQYSLKNL